MLCRVQCAVLSKNVSGLHRERGLSVCPGWLPRSSSVCVFCISVGFGVGCKSFSRNFLLTVQECKVGDIDVLISQQLLLAGQPDLD